MPWPLPEMHKWKSLFFSLLFYPIMKRDVNKDYKEGDQEIPNLYDSARVYPNLRSSLMPSVSTRRSTRVFVPKTVVKASSSDSDAKVLRSGKRLTLDKSIKVSSDGKKEQWVQLLRNSEGPENEDSGESLVAIDGNSIEYQHSGGVFEVEEKQEFVALDSYLWTNESSRCDPSTSEAGEVLPKCSSIANSNLCSDDKSNEERLLGTEELDNSREERMFGVSYTRKRQRSAPDVIPHGGIERISNDKMYGISFVRRDRRKKRRESNETGVTGIPELSQDLGLLLRNLSWRNFGQVMLVVLVETSSDGHHHFVSFLVSILNRILRARFRVYRLVGFLFSEAITAVFSGHGIHFVPIFHPEQREAITCCIEDCKSIGNEMSITKETQFQHPDGGPVSLLPHGKGLSWGALAGRRRLGFFAISGVDQLIPLVSVNYAALPTYFMSLHWDLHFRNPSVWHFIRRASVALYKRHPRDIYIQCPRNKSHLFRACYLFTVHDCSQCVIYGTDDRGLTQERKRVDQRHINHEVTDALVTTTPLKRGPAPSKHFTKSKKRQKKRNRHGRFSPMMIDYGDCTDNGEWLPHSVSHVRSKGRPANLSGGGAYYNGNKRQLKTTPPKSAERDGFAGYRYMNGSWDERHGDKGSASSIKVPSLRGRLAQVYNKPLEPSMDNMGFDNAMITPPQPISVLKTPQKRSGSEKFKEVKSAMEQLRQCLDSAICQANILIIECDKCYRESGAEIMLECSESKEWHVIVKMHGSTRYIIKAQAQEVRLSGSNRFTNALIWTGEKGWKLEFCDKRDWALFRELNKECYDRNMKAVLKEIPIPGVHEVKGYNSNNCVLFERPSEYIMVRDDEPSRALMNEHIGYDMDTEDEEWLERLNIKSSEEGQDCSDHISGETFEKIIHTFEKVAFMHLDDVFNESTGTSFCMDLGKKDMVAAIHAYWLRKRKRKNKSLVKVFEVYKGPPRKRIPFIPKPYLRKKRSFKRTASTLGGWGKSTGFLGEPPNPEAEQRVREATEAAVTALQAAMEKRKAAQMLMQIADLVVFRSIMATRIAEERRIAEENQLTDTPEDSEATQ
ncbi:uncharacterized protein LOC18441373 [Amborella trichopoda]|uniref:uncharacterized protein LOC18441373 n=1 Tax=Amborella trichopoda TaxID=13333 RepID=UPI0005D3F1A2|nr:uncharacterized protein LOC18441373 [Amborella trichopoda]|eukprot:XP_011625969.1 uncharacterized protein LOC18441373 [Amborella trichopoda]